MTARAAVPSVCDLIGFQARLRPQGLAVIGPAGPLSYAALARDIAAAATLLLEHGVTRDDLVGLYLGFTYQHLLLILALDRLSVPSMSFATQDGAGAPELRPGHAVTVVVAAGPPPGEPACRWISLPEPWRTPPGPVDAARLAALDAPPDALLRVLWSSGTTGTPKGAPIHRPVQASRIVTRRLHHALGPRTRYFTAMPASTSPGYVDPLAVLCAGGTVVLPAPAADVASLANAIGVTLTSATPALLTSLLGPADAPPGRLETVERLEVSGAPLTPSLAHALRLRLTPNLWTAYGTTETQRVAAADAALCDAVPDAVGWVLPEVQVAVADADGRPLPAGSEGLLRIRGSQVIAGYFRDPAATARHFHDGWFVTGDLGALRADGLLRVTGRIEDRIPRDGALVAPDRLEAVLRRVAGVTDAAVFPLAEPDGRSGVGAALVLSAGADPALIRRAVIATLGPEAPDRLLVVERLPRTAAGKLLRRELVARAQAAQAAQDG